MSFDLLSEVKHAEYRDKIWNQIEALGFTFMKEDTELTDEDLEMTLKTIKNLKHHTLNKRTPAVSKGPAGVTKQMEEQKDARQKECKKS